MSASLVLDTLLEASGRAVLVAGFVAIALALFRAKAPALRHAVWTAALATMLALPLMSGWLPTMPFPLRLPSPALTRMVAVTEQADELSAPVDHRQMPKAQPIHGLFDVLERVLLADGDDLSRHDVADGSGLHDVH